MGRRITTAQFVRLVETARALSPDVALTSDVITGFPGETEALFAESLAFVKAMDFARLHVFPYSERKGTAATRLPDRVPPVLRHERAAEMRALGESMGTAYRLRFVGQRLPVLWENPDSAGRWRGLTDTYLQVVNDSKESSKSHHAHPSLSLEGESHSVSTIEEDSLAGILNSWKNLCGSAQLIT
jgi:threonylcarbamoyladenosine tRNA methylthiotransferase MtaB